MREKLGGPINAQLPRTTFSSRHTVGAADYPPWPGNPGLPTFPLGPPPELTLRRTAPTTRLSKGPSHNHLMISSDEQIRAILTDYRNIAVVGLSPDAFRPSNSVAIYLLDHGYNVIPVNPSADEVLGLRSYPSLEEIPGQIDIVDVFRRSEHVPDIAREAAEIGAKVLWTQLGVISREGAEIAENAGLKVVMDRCTAIEHRRLVATNPD